MISCSIHYNCPDNADVTDPAVLVAAATLWEIKQKRREKLEKEMKMETVTVTPTVTVTADDAGAVRGKAVDAEDEEGAEDEERE